jgi:hypothetical protein
MCILFLFNYNVCRYWNVKGEVNPGVPKGEVNPGVPKGEVNPGAPKGEVNPGVPKGEAPLHQSRPFCGAIFFSH